MGSTSRIMNGNGKSQEAALDRCRRRRVRDLHHSGSKFFVGAKFYLDADSSSPKRVGIHKTTPKSLTSTAMASACGEVGRAGVLLQVRACQTREDKAICVLWSRPIEKQLKASRRTKYSTRKLFHMTEPPEQWGTKCSSQRPQCVAGFCVTELRNV